MEILNISLLIFILFAIAVLLWAGSVYIFNLFINKNVSKDSRPVEHQEKEEIKTEIKTEVKNIIKDKNFRSALYRKLYPRLLTRPRRKYKRIKYLLQNQVS